MQTFRLILFLLPWGTVVLYGGWELQEQGLYRSILSTGFIHLWDGRSRTAGIIQSHHGAFQTSTNHVEHGRVDGKSYLPDSGTATSWPIWASQGAGTGLCGWGILQGGSLLTPILSCCLYHLCHQPVWFFSTVFSRVGLVCSASVALQGLALGSFPKPHIWAALLPQPHLLALTGKLLKSPRASEMAFVSNKAAFWLPSLWPELQCKLQGASPWHHENHLYSCPNFPLQTQRWLQNHSNKTRQRLHPLPEQLGAACVVHQGHRLWARRGCSALVGQSSSHWSMWEADRK